MKTEELLTLLKDDSEYYSGIGKQFLSNSDVGTLLNCPENYGKHRGDGKVLAEGRLFHTSLLEPLKSQSTPTIDVSTRNTKAYKDFLEANNLKFCLLQKEYDNVMTMVEKIRHNFDIYSMIYHDNNEFEVPAVMEFNGTQWKGKADIVGDNCLIDLKTTSDITKFSRSASSFNYDSQCFIYQTLFNKPLKFIAIDKETLQIGVFEPSDDFVERGEKKVIKAIQVYTDYFSSQKTKDIRDYYIQQTLN
jgi:hypothetical protein